MAAITRSSVFPLSRKYCWGDEQIAAKNPA
jgi:hypothetical protein